MREISFRGKRANNGTWLLGDCRHWRPDRIGIHDYNLHHTIEIITETLGQYTGLKDKNGKRIFEGDILKTKLESGNYAGFEWPYMRVGFTEGAFCLFDKIGRFFAVMGAFTSNITFEVVGNIHDNPELLEVQHA